MATRSSWEIGGIALVSPSTLISGSVKSGSLILVLVSAFVVIAPNAKLVSGLSFYDSKRVIQIGLLLLNAAWLLASFKTADGPNTTYKRLSPWGHRLLVSLFLLGSISTLLAPLPLYGFLEVFHLFLLGALALTVAHVTCSKPISQSMLVGVVVLSASLYVLSFVVGYVLSHLSSAIQVWPAGYIGFGHVRFFNQFQTWTLPLLALAPLMFAGSSRRRALLLLIPAAAFWMLLWASGGRGTLLGMISAMAVLLVVLRRPALPWLKVQGIAAATGALAYGLLFKVLATTDASLLDRSVASDMGRFRYWNEALGMAKENWLLGIGPMHHASFTTEFWSHPHNSLLLFAAEWGLPATVLLLALLTWAFWAWIQQSRAASRQEPNSASIHIRIALTASLVAASVHAMFSGLTVMPMSQTMMALVVGWTLGMFIRYSSAASASVQSPLPLWRRSTIAAVLGAAIVVVTAVALPDAFRREQSEENYIESVNPKHFHPRYWRQGAIRY